MVKFRKKNINMKKKHEKMGNKLGLKDASMFFFISTITHASL